MTVLDMNSSVPQTREPRRETPSHRRMISGLNSGKEMSSEGQYPSNFPGLGKSSYSGPLHETKCDLLCDTKYLLHSSQYQLFVLECQQRLTQQYCYWLFVLLDMMINSRFFNWP